MLGPVELCFKYSSISQLRSLHRWGIVTDTGAVDGIHKKERRGVAGVSAHVDEVKPH